MATIVEMDEIKRQTDNEQKTCPDIDKSIMEQIMVDPMGCLDDDEFMLTYVVDNGINASLLVEALGLEQLRIEIQGQEYKMFYCKPHPMFDHSDVMFNTKKYKEYNGKIHRVQSVVAEEIKAEIEALPTNTKKPGMSPFFQKI